MDRTRIIRPAIFAALHAARRGQDAAARRAGRDALLNLAASDPITPESAAAAEYCAAHLGIMPMWDDDAGCFRMERCQRAPLRRIGGTVQPMPVRAGCSG